MKSLDPDLYELENHIINKRKGKAQEDFQMTVREAYKAGRQSLQPRVDFLEGYKQGADERIKELEHLLKGVIEDCALTAESVTPRHTECGNKIAAAIRATKDQNAKK